MTTVNTNTSTSVVGTPKRKYTKRGRQSTVNKKIAGSGKVTGPANPGSPAWPNVGSEKSPALSADYVNALEAFISLQSQYIGAMSHFYGTFGN